MSNQNTILLLTKDEKFREAFNSSASIYGYKLFNVSASSQLISIIEKESISLAFLDIDDIFESEMDLVYFIKSRSANTEVVVLVSIENIEYATNALKNGAAFYLIKPIDSSGLSSVLNKLSLKIERQKQYLELEKQMLSEVMYQSESMRKVLEICFKIAPTSSTITLEGESGTGKEYFAKIIHRLSRRTDGPFVAVNCGAIPENLFESEFFGHKKGSFTGADRDKIGLIEEANLGTLFLDEIGELSPNAQVKLLRFLQDKNIRRVGDTVSKNINVRIIAATNKNLAKLVEEGKFRDDLFYRINVFHVTLPPLRERKETIPYLIKMFVQKYNLAMEKAVAKISGEAESMLASYDYPGNIRELENIIEHAVALSNTNELLAVDLPEKMRDNKPMLMAPQRPSKENGILKLSEMEEIHIKNTLEYFNKNYSETATALGISRSTLWRKLKDYGIETTIV